MITTIIIHNQGLSTICLVVTLCSPTNHKPSSQSQVKYLQGQLLNTTAAASDLHLHELNFMVQKASPAGYSVAGE